MRIKSMIVAGILTGVLFSSANAQSPQSQTERNKTLVLDFWRVVFEAQNAEAAKNYLAEDYIQHNLNVASGSAGFVNFFSRIWKQPKPVEATLRNPPVLVMAEGDLVTLVFKRLTPEPSDTTKRYESFWFDTLRVKDGKLVEHWDPATKPTK